MSTVRRSKTRTKVIPLNNDILGPIVEVFKMYNKTKSGFISREDIKLELERVFKKPKDITKVITGAADWEMTWVGISKQLKQSHKNMKFTQIEKQLEELYEKLINRAIRKFPSPINNPHIIGEVMLRLEYNDFIKQYLPKQAQFLASLTDKKLYALTEDIFDISPTIINAFEFIFKHDTLGQSILFNSLLETIKNTVKHNEISPQGKTAYTDKYKALEEELKLLNYKLLVKLINRFPTIIKVRNDAGESLLSTAIIALINNAADSGYGRARAIKNALHKIIIAVVAEDKDCLKEKYTFKNLQLVNIWKSYTVASVYDTVDCTTTLFGLLLYYVTLYASTIYEEGGQINNNIGDTFEERILSIAFIFNNIIVNVLKYTDMHEYYYNNLTRNNKVYCKLVFKDKTINIDDMYMFLHAPIKYEITFSDGTEERYIFLDTLIKLGKLNITQNMVDAKLKNPIDNFEETALRYRIPKFFKDL